MEIWKDIPGYEARYRVSSEGRVLSLIGKPKILKPCKNNTGYLLVSLGSKRFSIHRLVAFAFIPNPHSKPHINHIDFNRLNNRVENLEWVTHQENMTHGLDSPKRKDKNRLRPVSQNLKVDTRHSPVKIYHEDIREKALRYLGLTNDEILEETKQSAA